MSLATRCPACGTVFRVVRDQLKVSEGWVRCGRCSEVFDAGQRLFELEHAGATTPALPNLPAPSQGKSRLAAATIPADAASADSAASADAAALSPAMARVHKALAPPSDSAVHWAPERDSARPLQPTPVTQAAATDTLEPAPASPDASAPAEAPAEPTDETTAAAAAPTPDFILRADRAARWRHPARRSALAALSLLLAALLAAQIAVHYRDALAAGWPASRPGLQAACNLLGCRIEAPRRIDSLSVDSSGLVRVEDSALYRLSLVLQNKAPTAVRMPAIELALTDTQGQTMARRVLFAAELGNPSDSLPARGEVALQATLDLGTRRVAGYTVELFYP